AAQPNPVARDADPLSEGRIVERDTDEPAVQRVGGRADERRRIQCGPAAGIHTEMEVRTRAARVARVADRANDVARADALAAPDALLLEMRVVVRDVACGVTHPDHATARGRVLHGRDL